MTEIMDGCLFCVRTDHIVVETEHVFISLDDAPIVEGHVIVCPRLHYPSMADVPAEVARDADRLLDNLIEAYQRIYGPTVIYEHGRTGQCLRRNPDERICHHSHLHMMPLATDLPGSVELSQYADFTSLAELAELAGDVEGYILAGSSLSTRRYFPVTRPLGPHYLRTLASTLAGVPDRADWEAHLFTPESKRLQSQAAEKLAAFAADLTGTTTAV
ncbi:HIT domain-containing protein [Actinoplanes sp. NPDC051475]|uniref:HIT family protein n=1 Tax=Actinoplanes sp. NPDC051475 TaxID=3157225 RepID=UPI00344C0630